MTSLAQNNTATDICTDYQAQPLATVIDFILHRFHEPLRRELPDLVQRSRHVEQAESASLLCPRGLADHVEQIRLAVESHLAKEEQILFPLILAGRGANARMPIRVMMTEHDDHTANLRRTRALVHDFVLPADASAAWCALYDDLRRFEDDLNQHIAIENRVLFPRALDAER